MSNIKTYKGKELISILKKIGFDVIRIKGSHHYLKHEDGRGTVIPVHSNEDIGIGLFMKILKDIDISKDDFEKL
ncbi:MAG: type II toxin-antitoxin system HicA family toxin [FCB group bacterium]|jgi:predicted RNA binding protein YcfA (HicA-like mRNA interferase family)